MATHSSVLAWRIPGTGSLVGCRLWGRTESDMTDATWQQQQQLGLKAVMASGSITSWKIDREIVETVSDFIITITADGDCSHEIKRRLLLERKVMTNLLLMLNRFSRIRLCATP